MKVMEAEFAKEFIRLCEDGWKKGWHEYHGGNLSYRLSAEEIRRVRDGLSQDRAGWVTMEREYRYSEESFSQLQGAENVSGMQWYVRKMLLVLLN